MASAPVSQESPPTLPLPLTPLTDSSSPPIDSPPPPDSSSPPPPTPSSPPPDVATPSPPEVATPPPPEVATPPPPEVETPPPIDISLPPPLVLDSPPPQPLPPILPPPLLPSPPPPDTSTPVVSPPLPPSSPSPPPPAPEVSPPPPSPPPAEPTPSVDSPSPPPPSPPPKSVKSPPSKSVMSPPPSSTSTTTFSPPPPENSPSHQVPPPPPTSSENTPSNPRSKPSTSDASPTMLQDSSGDNNQAVKTGVAVGVVVAFFFIGFMLVIVCVRRRRKRHDRYNSVHMLPSQFVGSQVSGSSFMKPMPSVGDGFNSGGALSSGGGGGFGGSGGGTSGSEYMSSSADSGMLGHSMTGFSYEQLNTATNGFASQNILGAGGFGCVYKGFLQDGRVVAVKKLKDNSGQGDREFTAEVETISRVHHRHLVSLVGYCATDYQRLLVYEFLPNNTLHYHLHAANKPVMEWSLRVKVACGAARGLAYLHEDCHPKIIHRDIKSANIILDQNFEAKVADFGLAKLAQELELNTHVSTRVMGTFGYMAPEYASSGKLTEKSDVFSFGVVLLELITARKPVDERRPLGDESLVEWARPLMTEALESQNFSELADSKLQENYDRSEMFRMIEAAAACVRHSSTKRPKMSQVVRALDTMSELSDISNGMKPGESGIFDSREQSMQIRMFQRMAFGSQDMSSSEYGNSQSSWANGGRSGVV